MITTNLIDVVDVRRYAVGADDTGAAALPGSRSFRNVQLLKRWIPTGSAAQLSR